MNIYFYDRKDITRVMGAVCRYDVEWLSWAELGGPDRGRVRADGPLPALQELNRLLRSPVRILDELGVPSWWGFVNEIELHLDGVIYVMTLDGLANRVAVRWSDDGGSPLSSKAGYDYQTGWADNLTSQAEYGVKEMIFEIGEARQAQAENARLTQLLKRVKPATRSTMGERNAKPFALLRLAGWIHTVGWRFYAHNRGFVGNIEWSGIAHEMGNAGPHTKVGQQFTTPGSAAWDTSELWLRLYRVGSPGDNVTVALMDSGAVTTHRSVTFAGSTLEREATGWKKVVWSSPFTLSVGTVYMIVLSRSGANDANNYYGVRIEQGVKLVYAFLQYQNGVGWSAEVPNASMVMGLFGIEETTVQLKNILAAGVGGQFLTGVKIGTASGVKTRMYRPGKLRAIDELKDMLLTGTSAGDELRATINDARVMVIDARPAQPASAELYIYPSGEIRHKSGGRLLESPVGKWARVLSLQDAGGTYNPAGAVYITRAEWDTLGAPGAGGRLRVKWE